MTREQHDNAGVLLFPPLVYALPLIAGFSLQQYVPFGVVYDYGVMLPLATLVFGFGAILILWSLRAFREAKENPSPYSGVNQLIIDGPYQISRNPMYLAFTFMYLGLSFVSNSWWPLIFAPAILMVMNYAVIIKEENYMYKKFGQQYLKYKKQTRRWI